MKNMEKWQMMELVFTGKRDGNPYMDDQIAAEITKDGRTRQITGFYDGEGQYKVRFMPEEEGIYHYQVSGSFSDKVFQGEFEVCAPIAQENHGPVRVVNQVNLEYADGTPYYSIGTTCYAWVHQTGELQEQTLKTLSDSCFNKIRFCIFPKYYQYNTKEPSRYPFMRGEKRGQDQERLNRMREMSFPGATAAENITDFDFFLPDYDFFKHFDQQVEQLCRMGIEADIILFHPYDKWGFANMTSACDKQYLRYIVSRYAAYRNVWWSMANEYDLMTKTIEEWEELGTLVQEVDPYGHLRSIHNCGDYYDYHKAWITHCSMQRQDFYKHVELTDGYLQEYHKPVVWDEICYEGNISMGWGNITGEELVRRFWEAFLRGGQAGHGETFLHPQDILWWSHGGVLHGTSEPRLAFLHKIMQDTPGKYLKKGWSMFDEVTGVDCTEQVGEQHLFGSPIYYHYQITYYGFARPGYRDFFFPEDQKYRIEVIDTWNMTITDRGIHSGETHITLPSRQYMAVRLTRVEG